MSEAINKINFYGIYNGIILVNIPNKGFWYIMWSPATGTTF